MQTSESPLRLAVVGCGRASASLHLPAIAVSAGARAEVLVDLDVARARTLARRFGVPHATDDVRDVLGLVDAAVIALPHHVRTAPALPLLEGGVPLLVEKPLALTTRDADTLIEAAERTGRVLAVGMTRRWFPALAHVRALLASGALGDLSHLHVREGGAFRWAAATDFTFRREAGGGVLSDVGIHVLDTLCWWLGEGRVVRYADDAAGGVEAECEIELAFDHGVPATVELSRLRDLPPTCTVRGERGWLEVGTAFDGTLRSAWGDGPVLEGAGPAAPRGLRDVREAIVEEVEDFVAAVRGERSPHVSGVEARRAVALLEACRASPEALTRAWRALPG